MQLLRTQPGPRLRQKTEDLLAELLAMPEKQRCELLQEERFQSHAFFELLLDRIQAAPALRLAFRFRGIALRPVPFA